ncbi:hypothetical protein B7494_g5769 [Chlorociboria aeruginascens]|nr:hypothetical protein B7494_g5769 [Chlorociboria aeruginascens]
MSSRIRNVAVMAARIETWVTGFRLDRHLVRGRVWNSASAQDHHTDRIVVVYDCVVVVIIMSLMCNSCEISFSSSQRRSYDTSTTKTVTETEFSFPDTRLSIGFDCDSHSLLRSLPNSTTEHPIEFSFFIQLIVRPRAEYNLANENLSLPDIDSRLPIALCRIITSLVANELNNMFSNSGTFTIAFSMADMIAASRQRVTSHSQSERRLARPGSSSIVAPLIVSCTWTKLNIAHVSTYIATNKDFNIANISIYIATNKDLNMAASCAYHLGCKGHHIVNLEKKALLFLYRFATLVELTYNKAAAINVEVLCGSKTGFNMADFCFGQLARKKRVRRKQCNSTRPTTNTVRFVASPSTERQNTIYLPNKVFDKSKFLFLGKDGHYKADQYKRGGNAPSPHRHRTARGVFEASSDPMIDLVIDSTMPIEDIASHSGGTFVQAANAEALLVEGHECNCDQQQLLDHVGDQIYP